jgi:capsular polysaccharide biosynthesis protein/Mrp family chromosome partitioning ATPase
VDDTGQDFLSLRDYLEIIARRRRIVATLALITVVGAAVATLFTKPTFESTVEVLLQPPSEGDVVERALLGNQDLATQLKLITSSVVAERVASDLGRSDDPGSLEALIDEIEVSLVQGTSIVELTASDEDAQFVAALPVAFAEAFLAYQRELADERISAARDEVAGLVAATRTQITSVDEELTAAPAEDVESLQRQRESLFTELRALEDQLAQLQVADGLVFTGDIISPVTIPSKPPLWPLLLRNLGLGLVLGTTLGVGLALVREWVEDGIVRERDVHAITARPVLATLPRADAEVSSIPYRPDDPVAVTYRALRTAVRAQLSASPSPNAPMSLTSLLVTAMDGRSPAPEVAVNLAVAYARGGRRVLLIDAATDPTASRSFTGAQEEGLHQAVLAPDRATALAQATEFDGLRVMPSGPVVPGSRERLTAETVIAILDEVKSIFDVVVISAEPLRSVGEASELAVASSGVLLVGRWQRSSRDDLRESMERLHQLQAWLVGTVFAEGAYGHLDGSGPLPNDAAFPVADGDQLPHLHGKASVGSDTR